ncbi:response regulator [Algibacter sp. L4_22]|uniref:response regulator n=1 Tax=Algibacter sp. L4_22 TaxID=2942477 RepID=UPI00201B4C9C|nr:response regulator [Algibacter sp. L4_22]MCL5127103.1 response regulator [Algibacter sp. L4_22]
MESLQSTLLIDDDKFTNFYNEKIVKKHNTFNSITSVNSGADALVYLQKAMDGLVKKPDVIFLDINMPAMNGWEFIEEYSKLDKIFTSSIKIIMLTTSSNPQDQEKANSSSFINSYINKPLSTTLLDEALNFVK